MSSSSDTAMQIFKKKKKNSHGVLVPLKTHRDKHVCKLVKKWLTNNVPQILTPLTGMSFPGLDDSCDRVIVFVTRKSGVDLGFSLGGGAPLTD